MLGGGVVEELKKKTDIDQNCLWMILMQFTVCMSLKLSLLSLFKQSLLVQ